MKWFLKVLRQFADFKGRAGREEYLMFVLFYLIATCVLMAVGFGIMIWTEKAGAFLLPILFMFALLIPGWAVLVRRLHDTGRSAWFCLVSLIPIIGGIWLLIVLLLGGEQGENRYGENPAVRRTNNYERKRSAAVGLIISSVFWLLLQTVLFLIRQDGVDGLLSMMLPVGLLIAGITLFSKRKFSADMGWSLIILSVVWLLRDSLKIWNSYSYLALSFNILLIIDMLNILIPVALFVTGIFIVIKKSDRTVPVCLLFVGSCVWILTVLLNTMQFSVDMSAISEISLLISNMTVIAVPVSLMVFARTLLSKNTTSKENGNELPEPEKIERKTAGQPVTSQSAEQPPPESKPSTVDDYRKKIVFVREDKDNNNVWIVYKAPTKADAIEFLSRQRIIRPSYYLVVETPEGNFGRDKDGFYQE